MPACRSATRTSRPRVGFAYRFGEKTVFRAGYGLTWDPLPFGRPFRGLYPSTLTGSFVPTQCSTYGWFNTINEGIPEIATPDVSKGQAVLPLTIDMGPRSPWGGQIHRGYIQSWNGTLERQLPFNMIGSVGYVATRTIHQLIDRNINTVGPGIGTSTAKLPLGQVIWPHHHNQHVGRHRRIQLPLDADESQQAVHATGCWLR